jgi:hypothetical protein
MVSQRKLGLDCFWSFVHEGEWPEIGIVNRIKIKEYILVVIAVKDF